MDGLVVDPGLPAPHDDAPSRRPEPPRRRSRGLASSPAYSSSNNLFQPQRVPDRIPTAVVIEVDEHVLAHALPLPDAVRPPAQIVIAVRARVQMIVIGSVKPGIDKRRRHP